MPPKRPYKPCKPHQYRDPVTNRCRNKKEEPEEVIVEKIQKQPIITTPVSAPAFLDKPYETIKKSLKQPQTLFEKIMLKKVTSNTPLKPIETVTINLPEKKTIIVPPTYEPIIEANKKIFEMSNKQLEDIKTQILEEEKSLKELQIKRKEEEETILKNIQKTRVEEEKKILELQLEYQNKTAEQKRLFEEEMKKQAEEKMKKEMEEFKNFEKRRKELEIMQIEFETRLKVQRETIQEELKNIQKESQKITKMQLNIDPEFEGLEENQIFLKNIQKKKEYISKKEKQIKDVSKVQQDIDTAIDYFEFYYMNYTMVA